MDWGFRRHHEAFAGCHAYAEKAGWNCFIHPAPERVLMKEGGELEFDGIIARATSGMADAARKAGTPIVNIWTNSPAKDLPSVFPDSKMAGNMAAEHLLSRGFRNFGFLGHRKDISSEENRQGFSETLNTHGFHYSSHLFSDTDLANNAPNRDRFISGLERWIGTWKAPIGIFVGQDLYCRYLIDVCRDKGLFVSQDVAMVGCGNETLICNAPLPSLTSIDDGYSRVGYKAAELLDSLMSGGAAPAQESKASRRPSSARSARKCFWKNDRGSGSAMFYG